MVKQLASDAIDEMEYAIVESMRGEEGGLLSPIRAVLGSER